MATTYKVLGQSTTASATRTIVAKQLSSRVASITTNATHNMAIGQNVTIANVAHTASVTNKVLTSSVATLTFTDNHSYSVGTAITVTGVDTTFNGTYNITAIGSNTVSYAKSAANVSSQASPGTVTGLDSAFNGIYTVTGTPSATVFTFVSGSSITHASLSASGTATHIPWHTNYTCPASTSAITSTMVITNRGSKSAAYHIALSSTASPNAIDPKEYLVYNDLVAANDMVAMTLGITIDASVKYLHFVGSHASLSFNVFGAETT
jgi:hypothetical protein